MLVPREPSSLSSRHSRTSVCPKTRLSQLPLFPGAVGNLAYWRLQGCKVFRGGLTNTRGSYAIFCFSTWQNCALSQSVSFDVFGTSVEIGFGKRLADEEGREEINR